MKIHCDFNLFLNIFLNNFLSWLGPLEKCLGIYYNPEVSIQDCVNLSLVNHEK